jgi:hypothetical protein
MKSKGNGLELKEFVKTSAQSIIDATRELILENQSGICLVNPVKATSAGSAEDVVGYHNGFLPVTEISFDIAVTEEKSKSGDAGTRIKVASFELGANGRLEKIDSVVSRIGFKFRIALPTQNGVPKKSS